jgi:alkyl hydroperoxide reductase subunit D
MANETLNRIVESFNIPLDAIDAGLQLMGEKDHKYLKDLRINLSNALSSPNIDKKQSLMLALSAAINEQSLKLVHGLKNIALAEGVTEDEIAEIYACVSLMNVNNVFYRFKHFVGKEYYTRTPAGIKMSIMVNPVMGKELFELMSLMLSALNGCEQCVRSHEASVLQHGASEARVYDAIRLGAIIKGFTTIL